MDKKQRVSNRRLPPLSKIEETINNAPFGWILCFVSEDQSQKLGTITRDLSRPVSEVGDGKRIAPGLSYWGIGPALAWGHVCNDPFHPVMKETIDSFPLRWAQIQPDLDHQSYHYASLGIGTGQKDRHVLSYLHKLNPQLFYFPVDLSPEMLRIGVKEAIIGTQITRGRILPIQLDFSIKKNIEECSRVLEQMVGEEPILFSLLGNTLTNFEDEITELKLLSQLIRPQDRLLLELAYIDDLDEDAVQEAVEEYSKSKRFGEFVTSALLQNTDIDIHLENISFIGEIEQDKAIRIKALYRNGTGTSFKITLPDSSKVDFSAEDTIRLYLTRKYTSKGIEALLSACGLSPLSRERSRFDLGQSRFNSGTELMLLTPSKVSTAILQQPVFISYGAPDEEFATKLNQALKEKGISTYFFAVNAVPGEKLHKMMRKGVNESERVILVCSQQSLQRSGVLNELDLVLARESREGGSDRLLPITLDRYIFEGWQPEDSHLKTAVLDHIVCDFRGTELDNARFNAALEKLLKALKSMGNE